MNLLLNGVTLNCVPTFNSTSVPSALYSSTINRHTHTHHGCQLYSNVFGFSCDEDSCFVHVMQKMISCRKNYSRSEAKGAVTATERGLNHSRRGALGNTLHLHISRVDAHKTHFAGCH